MMNHILGFIVPFLFFNPLAPMTVPSAPPVSLTTVATSSEVKVVTDVNGKTNTTVVNAPYGVESELTDVNGAVSATTTPLTEAQVETQGVEMEQQEAAIQNQMNQLMQDQQKLFQDLWNSGA
ncbi:MAG: hypothetical protein ACREGH_00215 [Minisyncoccia bacterium]